MKPDSVGAYIRLKEESIEANRALQAFQAGLSPELVPGIENLDYCQRFDRLYETVLSYAKQVDSGQSSFGKNAWQNYHAPMRIVTSTSGEEYGLVFNVYVSRHGFQSPEKKEIHAGWFDLDKKHSDSVFGPTEKIENQSLNIGALTDIEWAVEAYLTGIERDAGSKQVSHGVTI